MVMILLENSNIEKVKDKLSQCFLTNLELGIWDLKDILYKCNLGEHQ